MIIRQTHLKMPMSNIVYYQHFTFGRKGTNANVHVNILLIRFNNLLKNSPEFPANQFTSLKGKMLYRYSLSSYLIFFNRIFKNTNSNLKHFSQKFFLWPHKCYRWRTATVLGQKNIWMLDSNGDMEIYDMENLRKIGNLNFLHSIYLNSWQQKQR